jgi:hypothetical protein
MNTLPLLEPVTIDDDLCRLGLIEDCGFGARLIYVSRQTCFEADCQVCLIKRKIVLPNEDIAPAIEAMQNFLGRRTAVLRPGLVAVK